MVALLRSMTCTSMALLMVLATVAPAEDGGGATPGPNEFDHVRRSRAVAAATGTEGQDDGVGGSDLLGPPGV